MPTDPDLTDAQRVFLSEARRALLTTIGPDGRPRPVPICFVLADDGRVLYSPLDDKPKRDDDPMALARVRDVGRDPRVTILVDRWDEDWTRLAWLRVDGLAGIVAVSDAGGPVLDALRAKYPQYAGHRLETRPLIRVELGRVVGWP